MYTRTRYREGEIMTDPGINLQPHLGRVHNNYKPENSAYGLQLAKVLKVHHKHGTADVRVVRSNDVISSSEENQGKFAARMLTSSAHYDNNQGMPSGTYEPILEGQLVVIGFLDGFKNQPVILGSFHNTFEEHTNVLPYHYPIDPTESGEQRREYSKYLKIFPAQGYHRVDGLGGVEISHPSKSFLKIDTDHEDVVSDGHNTYGHEDLSEKNPNTNLTYCGYEDTTASPARILFVHTVDGYTPEGKELDKWTKIFVDKDGTLRITRDNNDDRLSYIQMDAKGNMLLRRQNDSPEHHSGSKYTEIALEEDGTCRLERNTGTDQSSITITPAGDINGKSNNYKDTNCSGDDLYTMNQQGDAWMKRSLQFEGGSLPAPSEQYRGQIIFVRGETQDNMYLCRRVPTDEDPFYKYEWSPLA